MKSNTYVHTGKYDSKGRCGYDENRLMCKCCRCENRCDRYIPHYLKSTTYSVRGSNTTGYAKIKCVQITQKRVLAKLIKEGVKIF